MTYNMFKQLRIYIVGAGAFALVGLAALVVGLLPRRVRERWYRYVRESQR